MQKPPKISVLLAVYNGEDFLRPALNSLLSQSEEDWECIIIDDYSSDDSPNILGEFAKNDNRFMLSRNEKNIGLAASLNKGLSLCKGEYVLRMDADDICLPERFKIQSEYMDNHPGLVLCGSNAEIINTEGQLQYKTNLPLYDHEIRPLSLIQNCFIHPSVIIRRQPISDYNLRYDESFDTTQDWAFWIKFLAYGNVANLPQALLQQRHHDASISFSKRERQIDNSLRIQKSYLETLGLLNLWDLSVFKMMNEGFLNDRTAMISHGYIRPIETLKLLKLITQIRAKLTTEEYRELKKFFIKRAIQIGLMPPIETGWWLLFVQLIKSPNILLSSILSIYRDRK